MARKAKPKTRARAGGGVSLDISGDAELIEALSRIGVGVRTKVLRSALHTAMDVVTAAAKARAPVLTGRLKASLRTANGKTNSKWKVRVLTRSGAGDFKGDTFYAAIVEFGGRDRRPHPFLTPAFEANKARALAVARAEILAGVDREVWWASFRKTTVGRVFTKARRRYATASKATRKAGKKTLRIYKRTRKRAVKATRKARRSAARTARKVRKSAVRKVKAARRRPRRRK